MDFARLIAEEQMSESARVRKSTGVRSSHSLTPQSIDRRYTMKLKAILTATALGTVLAFSAFPTGARDVRVLGTTIASAEEHQEANENDPAAEAKELSAKISREKAEGTDVSAAVAHQQKGEAAMKAGNTKDALEHFEQAERALGESEEHEKDKD
jgi:hypothetical protein